MRRRLPALVLVAALVAGCTVHGPDTCGQVRPSARTGTVAVLVPTTNQVYLYGGQTAQSLDAADLWRYDFVGGCANGGWTQLHLETMPRDIGSYAAAFDSKRHRILYVSFDSQAVWALDSDALKWSQLRPTGALSAASAAAGAVYDEEHDRLLVGTHQLGFGASDDGAWSNLPLQANMKLPVIGPASAIDPLRRAVYSLDDAGALTVYTFLTDAQQPVALSGDPFGAVAGARMGWDSQAKRMVVFAPDGVYAFAISDGTGTAATVTHLAPTGAAPPARADAAFAMSGPLGFVFGGQTAAGCLLDDTYYLSDEASWSARAVATTCL